MMDDEDDYGNLVGASVTIVEGIWCIIGGRSENNKHVRNRHIWGFNSMGDRLWSTEEGNIDITGRSRHPREYFS
jgi:hypothetical protein